MLRPYINPRRRWRDALCPDHGELRAADPTDNLPPAKAGQGRGKGRYDRCAEESGEKPAQAKAALAFAAGGRAAQAKAKAKTAASPAKPSTRRAEVGRRGRPARHGRRQPQGGKKAPVKAKKPRCQLASPPGPGRRCGCPAAMRNGRPASSRPSPTTCWPRPVCRPATPAFWSCTSARRDGSATIATVLEAAADYGLAGQLLEKFGPGDPEGSCRE